LTELIIPAIISSVIAFFSVYFSTPPLIKFLQKRNFTVKDMNKKEQTMIPRPGGISIIVGIITSELILYAFLQMNEILAIMITTFFLHL
jgi:UDP-N-acetylglucosamine--dolichyl-phosphate N-acetylglucosaminephosphotransferase